MTNISKSVMFTQPVLVQSLADEFDSVNTRKMQNKSRKLK
jgi:hypothetical protein